MARGMRGAHFLALFCAFAVSPFRDAEAQGFHNDLTGFSLNPPYFNLAEGSGISATATCGQDEAGTPRNDLYCKLVGGPTTGLATQNIQGQFCDYCNSIDPNKAHPVTNAIDGTERWWQSPPLSRGLVYNEVNVTLDLGQLFHVAYVLIKFANSPRPDLWVLERSVDNGRTFSPWQYFAHSKRECIERFGKHPNARILHDDEQVCTTEYSRIVPLDNGEIVVSLVNGRPGSKNFTYSPVLRDFTKATNIRLRFLRTNTLLGHLISKAQRDPTVTRRYFYSIKDISIGGRCVCHGHAQVCASLNPGVLFPVFRLQCECQHNTCGESCDRCCPGFNHKPWRAATVDSPNECQRKSACNSCFSHAFDCFYDPEVEKRGASLDTFGRYDGGGVCIDCQHNTAGVNCERCIEGFYRPYGVPPESPTGCIPCRCDERTTSGCEMGSGRCICKPQFAGQNCHRCAEGYYSYPQCIPYPIYPPTTKSPAGPILKCICDYRGTVHEMCDDLGRCLCREHVEGERCDRCRPGYYSFPNSCQCSREGSHGSICNPLSGQCLCLPGVVGQQCDRCASGLSFPQCSGKKNNNMKLSNVEGTLCNRCKPLYWNLAADNPGGCVECQCDLKGTLSGVGECEQKTGQCHCKPNACGLSCDTCKDGYFLLQKKNYFGCQGCQCDIGGAIDMACDEMSGQCWCLKNVEGLKCTEPASSYYFPTLHQLKFEVEDGTTPNARPVRFGYNPQEFPGFSWRGYTVMSPAQVNGRQHLFRVVLRFINPSRTSVTGSIRATNNIGTAGSDQSKEVIFPQSHSPSFLTVPGEGFAEPFALTPGKWIIHIRAEGVLLDYLVLLPRDYYEASLLQQKITQPCTYLPTANRNTNYICFDLYSLFINSVLGSQGRFSSHPEMAALNGRQVGSHLSLHVPHPGPYALVLEYASELDIVQNVNILVSGHSGGQTLARANIYSCAYSFLCRSVAVDTSNQVAALQLTHRTELLLQTSTTSFLLYKVYAVPAEEFSIEYVAPKVLCVSTHGRFTEDSRHCVLGKFEKPTSAWILYAARDGQLLSAPAVVENEDWRWRRQSEVFPVREPQSDGILLKFPQISFTPRVPLPGRYVAVVHYHQPEHTSFPVEVRLDVGREWRGLMNASFCPAVSGCREVVIAEGRIALDFHQNSWQLPSISVIIPPNKTLILDYILLVPDSSYTPDLLKEKLLDKSSEFIQQCREEGFYIDPRTSSQFCRDSARSLVAAYNGGALPCNCDQSGSTGTTCDPAGGQCPCRRHVIGRQCTKCATGYYGFPYCRPCECGRRLCNEMTGSCICPPQTVKPSCDVCQNQTFSYHPSLGCEDCKCSPRGIEYRAGPDCDRITGQCSCKPRIGGRQCDRCAAGYYRFPDCVPCNCNEGGVTPDVCHPDTGQCLCKRNVAGVRCDTCQEGSFHFDPSNPHGCTSCFCFGATDQCHSSNKRRGKFVDMRGWHLRSPDQEEIPSVLNAASNTVVADVQELPSTVQTLHWVAPLSYLGDRVSSYGGFLTYQSKSFGIPSEGMTLMDRRPDVVLTGQDMTLIHMAQQVPLPDRLYQGRVQLVEGNWRHAVTNRPVSRQELMMVLAGLVGLRIRALYFTQSQRLSLGEVGLEEATTTGTGGPGNTVEHCFCPNEYTGDSCEKCAPGFYRDGSGPFLGRCVPCECNGLADVCEESTGRCLNCQYNTAGERCERCKEGYYGNAVQRSCRVCPCPFSVPTNSFAVGCREVYGDFQCICRAGYAGDKCERCAPGYYGDPLTQGGSCRPCRCNGHDNNCDPRTGVLDYIKANVSNQLDQNEAAAGKIRGLLKDYEAKLKDLDEALKEAKDLVKKANSQNGLNTQGMEELQEYEQLAAQLDGAKTDLTERVNEISKAAGKENLVVKAEKHAKDLDKLAKELEDAVKNASGRSEVRNAKDAIDAYKNITDAINAAEAAANEAKAAADNALNVRRQIHILHMIVIPMKFTGEGYVEMREPKNLDDLKAYTSLSLSLQRPEGGGDGRRRRRQTSSDMFVLYLGSRSSSGNYIGMVLRNNVLYTMYKLNGNEYPIRTAYISRSPAESSRFDRVELHRIYQDVQMKVTKDITSVTPQNPLLYNMTGNDNKNLLDLSPSDTVFYVGGYPANFTPPASLSYPKYQGCIEFSSFNDKIVSLYNFHYAEKVNLETPCKRYVAPVETSYFEGTGYGKVFITKTANTLLISMSIFTRSENGLLFYIGNEVKESTIFLVLSFLQISDWKDILIVMKSNGEISVRLASDIVATALLAYKIDEFKEYYIGGAPQDLREKSNITSEPFKGCMNNLKQQRDFKSIDEQVGISKGCPVESLVRRELQHAKAVMNLCSITSLSKPLFMCANGINLALEDSYVLVSFNSVVWKSKKQYRDGNWHYLTVTRKAGRYERHIDFTFIQSMSVNQVSGRTSITDTSGSLILGRDKFKGCISNLYTRRPHFSLDVRTRSPEGLLFFAATRGWHSHLALYMSKGRIRLSVGKQREIFNREKYNDGKWHSIIFSLEKKKFRLIVDGIRAQDGQLTNTELTSMQQFVSPAYLGSSKGLPKQSVSGCLRNFKMNGAPMSNPTTNRGAGPCFEGQTQRGTYFSGNGAHAIINDSFVVGSSFELLFNVRPRSLTGLLLHVGDFRRSQTSHYLSVYMLKGEVVARVNNGKGEFMVSVKPKDSLCDGTFHKISVIKRMNVIQLHVDTMDTYKIGPQFSTVTLTKHPLYVGGIPGEYSSV
uniref:Laminin subunit alpha 3 n=1 Tax=Anabas testudineus TaxID=64144 RepID=A0A7N6AH40_ANATE